MLSDDVIINIFQILLNKKIGIIEACKFRGYSIPLLKSHIYESQDFKNLRKESLEKINNVFLELLNIEHIDINCEKYWKLLINLKYNIDLFKITILDIIDKIKQRYKSFYKSNLDLDLEPTKDELINIFKYNCEVEFYISISDKFMEESQKKIDQLVSKIL